MLYRQFLGYLYPLGFIALQYIHVTAGTPGTHRRQV